MKTIKITKAQVETFNQFNRERLAENAAKKAKEDYRAKLDSEHPELKAGEDVAFVCNGQIIATYANAPRRAVNQTLLKTSYPKIYEDVCTVNDCFTLKIVS